MTNLKLTAIGDIATVYDGPHATPKKTAEGPIYLGIDAISNDGQLIPSAFAHLSEEDYPKWTKRVEPQTDDIVFSYEATLGRYAMIPAGFRGSLGRRLAVIRVDKSKVNPRWLFYYFLSPAWRTFIDNHTFHGSTVDRISVEDYPSYKVPLPELTTQNKTVAILAAIDDKIANNKNLIQNLEATARLIYDYWFTQFDFPDEHGKPYRSSGGDMTWNEVLKREIPKDWSCEKLGSIARVIRGVTYDASDAHDVASEGRTLLLRANNIGNGTINFDSVMYVNSNRVDSSQILSRGTIFICMSSGSKQHVGKTVIVPYDMGIAFGAFCSKIEADKDYRAYADMFIRSNQFDATIKQRSLGTNINNITSEMITELDLPLPSVDLSRRFNDVLAPFLDMYESLFRETQELQSLRDWLLPMLMNGQATITE